jgi:hypothetical protein
MGKLESGVCIAFRVLRLLPGPPDVEDHARYGGGPYGSRLEHCRTADGRGLSFGFGFGRWRNCWRHDSGVNILAEALKRESGVKQTKAKSRTDTLKPAVLAVLIYAVVQLLCYFTVPAIISDPEALAIYGEILALPWIVLLPHVGHAYYALVLNGVTLFGIVYVLALVRRKPVFTRMF